MKQREFIKLYNDANRPKFNQEFFVRDNYAIAESLKKIIKSCERDSLFTIKVLGFEYIEDYNEIYHILWQLEEDSLKKSSSKKKNPNTPSKEPTRKKDSKNAKINNFAYIDLKDTDMYLMKVDYFIKIKEKQDGVYVDASDTISVYIAIPRVVDKFYFKINGSYWTATYQIADASTYNNRTAKNNKKQVITYRAIFPPIKVFKYTNTIKNIDKEPITCDYFMVNSSDKNVLAIKYLFAKYGIIGTLNFLKLRGIYITQNIDNVNKEENHIFKIKDEIYIVANKYIFESVLIAQSYVFTLYKSLEAIKSNTHLKHLKYDDLFDTKTWVMALGADMTSVDTKMYIKGISTLDSLILLYDDISKDDLHLPEDSKKDVFHIIRWMMYEFNALRAKDNLDISTKKLRYDDYIASLYGKKLFSGMCILSGKYTGNNGADLHNVKQAINIKPMYLINAITSCNIINCREYVNDNDSILALKYTYKGVTGIGEKSNAIAKSYRLIHPSHLGRVDIDASSNSDPGISGTICPLATLHGNHFSDYEEPNTWEDNLSKVIEKYNTMTAKAEMCRFINNNKLSTTPVDDYVTRECISIGKQLIDTMITQYNESETIDLLNDGHMIYSEED